MKIGRRMKTDILKPRYVRNKKEDLEKAKESGVQIDESQSKRNILKADVRKGMVIS
jgi:hypothetical protein